jgi:hypothetical protein
MGGPAPHQGHPFFQHAIRRRARRVVGEHHPSIPYILQREPPLSHPRGLGGSSSAIIDRRPKDYSGFQRRRMRA